MFFSKKPPAEQPAAAAGNDLVKDTTTQAFAKDVIEASRSALVLVDFWAAWCGPCKQLAPVLEKVVKGYKGKVRLVKLNVDEHPQIPGQLRVQSLPTVYAFLDGQPVDGFMGLQGEQTLKAFIDRLLAGMPAAEGGLEDAVAEADAALEAGRVQEAAEIYAAVLQEEPQMVAAIAGLARCYLKSGDLARADQTLALAPPDKKDAAPIAAARAAIELARKVPPKTQGGAAGLQAKVAANPADHQARIDLAVVLATSGDKAGAVEQLIESFRRDRNWNEQAARKQLVELFEAWGPKDPATIDGRKRLSSILFS